MANLFLDNAYNVLGLDTSASQKEINKRAKDIINLLRIDEHSDYETDLGLAKVRREEGTVKEAVQRLSSPTKRIHEYFFWFDIENDNDEKALKLLQANDLEGAIQLWEGDAVTETASGFVAKKNLAILSSLILLDGGQKKYLTQSISHWKDIILSDKFWSHFEKLYALNDEVGTSKNALADFHKGVTDELSDFYTDVSQKHNDNGYYSLFAQVFGVKGQKMQRDVLSPIYEAIHDASIKLSNLNISEDNIISADEISTVRRLTRILQDNFDKLRQLGLYSDSESKTMRDKAAEALRTVALDLYNNLNESAKPIALLNIASKIAGTVNLQNKLSKDVEQMRKNVSNENIIKPINELLVNEEFAGALDLIEEQLNKHHNDEELTEYLHTRVQWSITGIASKEYEKYMEQFNKGQYKEAQKNFSDLRQFILSYIHYFDFDKDSLDSVLADIENMTNNAGALNIDNIQTYRNNILESAKESFSDKFEGSLLVFLIDSCIYSNLAIHIPNIKRKNIWKKWAWYIVIAIVLIFIFASNSSDSSTGTSSEGGTTPSGSSSAFDACKAEYDKLLSELEGVEADMSRYKANDDADSYNALVPRQNSLVADTNAKKTECNNL